MTWMDYIESARQNSKRRKKKGDFLAVLIFWGLFLFLTVNSVSDSVGKMVEKIREIPTGRTLIMEDNSDWEVYQELLDVVENDDRIIQVYKYIADESIRVSDIRKGGMTNFSAQSYSKAYEDYLRDGTAPMQGEIVLPKYLYGFSEEDYLDGLDFVGQTLTIRITDYNKQETEFSFVVCGTYDNVYSVEGNDVILFASEDAVMLKEKMDEGLTKRLLEEMKNNNDYDASHYLGYEKEYRCAIVVNKTEDIAGVKEDYADYNIHLLADTSQNTIGSVFEFIRFCSNVIMLVLFVTALIQVMIMVKHDVRERKLEMALYRVHGYTDKESEIILFVEYLLRILKGCIVAFAMCFVIVAGGNILITQAMSMAYSVIHLSFSPIYLCYGLLLVCIVLTGAVYQIKQEFSKMKLLEVLKEK